MDATIEAIGIQQQAWHKTRIKGAQLGIPLWERQFRKLQQTIKEADLITHTRIEKEFIEEMYGTYYTSPEDTRQTILDWANWKENKKTAQ